jgi:hypothetical protein
MSEERIRTDRDPNEEKGLLTAEELDTIAGGQEQQEKNAREEHMKLPS